MSISLCLKSGPARPRSVLAFLAFATIASLGLFNLMLASAPVNAAALANGQFIEADGWKARINVDCLIKDKLCGNFRYEALACEGDLIYTDDAAEGFEFRAELRAGRCLPGCTLRLSSDFKRYVEICKDSRHEGLLTPLNATVIAAPTETSAPSAVTIMAPAIASAKAEEPVPAAPPIAPGPSAPQRVERAADSTMKGNFTIDSKTGAVSGKLRIEWDNGNIFDGDMLNGKRMGKGRFTWANGQSYDGDWRDDVADGNAVIVFANGDRYQGQVKDGVPEGRGIKKFSNGDSYEGHFTNGVADVEGSYMERNGSRYIGQWKNGIKSGRGKFMWAEGQSYEGDWVADKPEGKGTIIFSNGDRYDGEISNGVPHGKGVKTYASSQDRYEGSFAQGEAQGDGIYLWKNGDHYDGKWQKGQKSGMGRYTWTNGDYWEGEFAEDKQTEYGRLYFTPTLVASSAEVEKLSKQTNAVAGAQDSGKALGNKAAEKQVDRVKLLAIPMVAKELRDCSRKDASDCATRVVDSVLNGSLFPHKWQTMSSEKDAKGRGPVFEVDANSELEAGNVFSWLRSGDGSVARNIGIKYDCRAQSLEIQLVYNCSGPMASSCALDPNIEKYAGKVIPATDIKNWFKGACER